VSLLVGYQPIGAVGYISYNIGTFDLPEIYTLALGPSCSCVYFRQITRAHVTYIIIILKVPDLFSMIPLIKYDRVAPKSIVCTRVLSPTNMHKTQNINNIKHKIKTTMKRVY